MCLPDYIGYGASKDELHPYNYGDNLALTSHDMMLATIDFLEDIDVSYTKVFLSGYSEGGLASMALQKYTEEQGVFEPSLSIHGSGAYDSYQTARIVLESEKDLSFMPIYLWGIHSYNRIYDIDFPWSYYVNEPYATTLSNESNPMNYKSLDLSFNSQTLFTKGFISDVLNKPDSEFNLALEKAISYNWFPQTPMKLVYGLEDNLVFPINSEIAFTTLKRNGADVKEVIVEKGNHETTFVFFVGELADLK